MGGVVGFEMGLDLQDINDDGRIHPSELPTMWNYTGNDAPGGLAQPDQSRRPGLLQGLRVRRCGYLHTHRRQDHDARVVDWTIFDITLAEWEYHAPTVQPVLAHAEGDTLIIHSGKRAGDREYLNYERWRRELHHHRRSRFDHGGL